MEPHEGTSTFIDTQLVASNAPASRRPFHIDAYEDDEKMAFELTVSAKRDPLLSGAIDEPEAPCEALTKIEVNGTFDEHASQAILTAVADLARDGARSIIVALHEVETSDTNALRSLSAGVMAHRGAGIHVQVAVRHEKLHARLAALPDSRDWLLGFKDADDASARRAIHVDGILKAG